MATGGLPALGLIGSAWSSVVTSSAMLLAYALVLRFDRRLHRYRLLGRWWRAEWRRFADVWRIGLPICATIVAEAGLFNGAALLIGRIGEVQLAAHTVAMQLAGMTFQVPFGLGQAATIRVGLAYGARDHAGIARAGWTALAMSVGFMGTMAALMLAPALILGLYIDVAIRPMPCSAMPCNSWWWRPRSSCSTGRRPPVAPCCAACRTRACR
jgi:MATE family multidrug resistance protein